MHANGKRGGALRGGALVMGACACAIALGLSGCVFTTPSRAEVEHEHVEPKVTADELVNAGYLTVAMDTTDAPQAMIDMDGAPSGYYADVARALAARMGLDLKVVSTPDAAGALAEGEADLYIGSETADVGEGVEVTEAIVEDASSIFMCTSDGSGETPALDVDSLSGAVIAVQDGSAAQDALVRGGVRATLKTCSNVNECFDALESGTVEYVACDATAGAYLGRACPGAVFVATVGSTTSYGISLPAGDSTFTRTVRQILSDLMDEGVLDAIYRTWYGSLPLGLSGEALAGLTVVPEGETGSDAGASDGAEPGGESEQVDGELTISGDLNSIG